MVGAHNKEILSMIFLVFYLTRLVQYLMTTCLGINMIQSNFVAIFLASMGIFTMVTSPSLSLAVKLSSILLTFDALLGAAIFIAINQEEIYKELGVYKEFKKLSFAKGLNCHGHITNLNMEYKNEKTIEA